MSKKQEVVSKPSAEKPLNIIVTVLPPKRGSRVMIVSAAREGEMPLMLGGPFADRSGGLIVFESASSAEAQAAVASAETDIITAKSHLEYVISPNVYYWEGQVAQAHHLPDRIRARE